MRRQSITVVGLALSVLLTIPAGPGRAQGNLLDALLGRLIRPATPIAPNPGAMPVPDLNVPPAWQGPPAGSVPFCVRLCDGKYFPLPHAELSSTEPTRLCRALCPHAATRIFWGTGIDNAVTLNHQPYSALENAFKFRTRLSANCTCNGKDAAGTAAISVYADTTLRPGDIVATDAGFHIFVGARGATHQPSDFVAAANYSRLPRDVRSSLNALDAAAAYAAAAALTSPAPRQDPAGAPPSAPAGTPADVESQQLTIRSRIIVGFEAFEPQPAQQPKAPLRITVTPPR